jgi:hypothetical protein
MVKPRRILLAVAAPAFSPGPCRIAFEQEV